MKNTSMNDIQVTEQNKIRLPVIFEFDEIEFDSFLEFVKLLDHKFVDKQSRVKLHTLKGKTIYNLPYKQKVRKEQLQQDILIYLNKLEGKEIMIGKLFKRLSSYISYKTFQRYVVELALNKEINTRKVFDPMKGNTTMISRIIKGELNE